MKNTWTPRPEPFDWGRIGDVIVTRSLEGTVPADVWQSMIEGMKQQNVRAIFSMGFGSTSVTALQRKAVADTMRELGLPAIVLTDDRLTRGILTAVSWLGAKIQAYSWNKSDAAFAALDVHGEVADQIRKIMDEFKRIGTT